MDGGDGIDIARYNNSYVGVVVNLATNVNTGGFAQGDTLVNIENIYGSTHDDNITGDDQNNFLYGYYGDDIINGGAGDDTISSGSGSDIMNAGEGSDIMWGGSGSDTFVYSGLSESIDTRVDTIKDFSIGEDKIDLSDLDFHDISQGQGSSESEGQLEYYTRAGNTFIEDTNSDFAIKLVGEITLNHEDFIF